MIDLDWLARAILLRAKLGNHPYLIGFTCAVAR